MQGTTVENSKMLSLTMHTNPYISEGCNCSWISARLTAPFYWENYIFPQL